MPVSLCMIEVDLLESKFLFEFLHNNYHEDDNMIKLKHAHFIFLSATSVLKQHYIDRRQKEELTKFEKYFKFDFS